jgi:hypothetical protein
MPAERELQGEGLLLVGAGRVVGGEQLGEDLLAPGREPVLLAGATGRLGQAAEPRRRGLAVDRTRRRHRRGR